MTVDYLSGQIQAGVEAVQLFDSWSGSLAPAQFEQWVIAPTARIVAALKERHPEMPMIGFPKGAGAKLAAYARETGVDALGLDETIDPVWAAASCRRSCRSRAISIRWPCSPAARRLKMRWGASYLAFAGRPHIFNLGHGIIKETPIAHVERLLALVREAPAGR